jgi:predicted nucleic acid-binding protein
LALIFDTGPLVALFNRGDTHHEECRRLVDSNVEARVVPAPVVVEIDWLLGSRGYAQAFTVFLNDVTEGAFDVEPLYAEDYQRALDLMVRYADSDIGFVDAAVLAIVERLGETKLATLDRRHFGMMRPRHVEVLRLLPA